MKTNIIKTSKNTYVIKVKKHLLSKWKVLCNHYDNNVIEFVSFNVAKKIASDIELLKYKLKREWFLN